MLKVVVVGYGQMFANLVLGCIDSDNKVVGAFRHDRIIYDPLTLKIKDIFAPSKDKSFIDAYKINEIQAKSINSEEFKKEIIKLNADIILIGSWSEKLKKSTINLPKLACINCHPSLLPKYRGPNPYAQVIKNGEKKTGITFHLVDTKFDNGPILYQAEVEVLETDTGETLKARCSNTAKTEVKKLLENLENEVIIPINQNEQMATYQKQLCEKDIILDFSKTAIEIDRHIRALTPWLKCYIPYKDKFFRVDKYRILENENEIKEAGTIVKKGKNSLQIISGDNKIVEFINLKMLDSIPIFNTDFYINFCVKIGNKAV